MGFAISIEHTCSGIGAHTAGPILVAYAFEWNSLLEVRMEGYVACRVPRSFEHIDPAVLEPVE